jgi:surfactin synthase thioesterase subunit
VALLRADFSLFDEYAYRRAGDAPFGFPMLAFHASADRKVSPALVQGWAKMTTGAFRAAPIQGHHLFVMGVGDQRAAKEAWLSDIVADLRSLV